MAKEYPGAISSTCLAVLKDKDGDLWFASDRRVSWGFHKAAILTDPKSIFRNNILMMGTGQSYYITILMHYMPFPNFKKGSDPDHFMEHKFLPSIIRYLKKQNLLHPKERRLLNSSDKNEFYGAILLVGLGSELYEVNVTDVMIDYDKVSTPWAHGCGGALAWGSLLTTESFAVFTDFDNLVDDMELRLKTALQVASRVSPGCDSNIDIINNKTMINPRKSKG